MGKRGPKYSPFSKEFYIHYRDMDEKSAMFEARSKRPTNIEYWIKKGFTESEAIDKVSEWQREQSAKRTKKIAENPDKYADCFPTQVGYWIKRGHSEEVARTKVTKVQRTNAVDSIQARNGCTIEEAQEIRDNITQKWLNTLASKTDQEKADINSRKNVKQSFIDRYGPIEGLRLWKERCSNSSMSLENLIKKHGEEKGTIRWNKFCASMKGRFTFQWFIEKYGEEIGPQKFLEKYQGLNPGRASKVSLKILVPLYKKLRREFDVQRDEVFWGISGSREWFIGFGLSFRLYDFTVPKLNLIIEFHGIGFHPNPSWPKEKWDSWKHVRCNYDADTQYIQDSEKKKYAEDNGYQVVEIYEDMDLTQIWSIIYEALEKARQC